MHKRLFVLTSLRVSTGVRPMFVRLLLILLVNASSVHAAITLGQTRAIVTEGTKKTAIQVHNADQRPMLLQTWVDAGTRKDDSATPPPEASPFLVDPPVMRLDPGQTRAIQVLLTQVPDTLPTDRETLFWLNVLEVVGAAPAASEAEDHHLTISIRSRLKLFYRPQALAQYTRGYQYTDADRLRFTLVRDGQNVLLSIYNPAPTHQNLATLMLRSVDARLKLDAPMLAPFEQMRLRIPSAHATSTQWRLVFAVIDDDGNVIDQEENLALTPATSR